MNDKMEIIDPIEMEWPIRFVLPFEHLNFNIM